MYQVGNVLPTCIEALRSQTYRSLELIFVDDCSPDESYLIVERAIPSFGALGIQVRLVRHEFNQGVAAARNTGLNNASGEFVFHYDADDVLQPTAIEEMVAEANRAQADIVGCHWMLCHGEKQRLMNQPAVSNGAEAFQAMCYGTLKWNLWLFLVRRSLLQYPEQIRFLAGKNMGEDMMLMGKVFLRAGRIAMLKRPLYYYNKNDAGQLTGQYTEKHWAQVDANVRELENFVLSTAPEQARYLDFLKLSLKLPLLISARKADYVRWANWFTEANGAIMHNPVLPMRTKLLQRMASFGQWWFVRLYYELIMKRLYAILYK